MSKNKFSVNVKVASLSFAWGSGRLVWGTEDIAYGDKKASSVDVSASYNDDDPWFAFYCEDCFDPSIHIIRAPTRDDAYEVFLDQEAERGHYVIDDDDPDYGDDDGTWTSSGVRVDSECFMGRELGVATIVCEVQS